VPKTEETVLMKPLLGLFTICLLSLPAAAQYGGGTGEPNNPYLIYTAEQMNSIGANRKDWDKCFKLMADIDLSPYGGKDFKVIGTTNSSSFRGVFDGNGKRISGFTTTRRDYTGLFGYVKGSSTEIRNLGLVSPNIEAAAGSYVGSLIGYLADGTITSCYASGVSVSGKKHVGGLIGYSGDGTFRGCRVRGGSVSGDENVGGLVGYNRSEIESCRATCGVSGGTRIGGLIGDNGKTITDSYATGVISADKDFAGGLIGENSGLLTSCSARGDVHGSRRAGGLVGDNSGPIIDCCASGDVWADDSAGGLVGSSGNATISHCYARGAVTGQRSIGGLAGSNMKTIANCYATGIVTGSSGIGGLVGINTWPGKVNYCYSVGLVIGTTDAGGLVGFNDEAIIKSSFWDVQTSGRSNMCGREDLGIGCNNDDGKTTVAMQRESTFLNAGWDFVAETLNGTDDIWCICDGLDYPRFAGQFLVGDFSGDNRVDLADFAIFADRWLESDRAFFWCRGADLTNDGIVDIDDLNELAQHWLTESAGLRAEVGYVVIDDFESYNDLDPCDPASHRIFDTWQDGYDNPAVNGCIVGYSNPPFTERQIVHGGVQSMPYFYNTLFKYSKAERLLDPPQNWNAEGAAVLSLWFRGDRSNAPAPMSIVLNGSSTVYYGDPNAVRTKAWTQWIIDLQKFADADLSHVSSIAICFGDKDNPQLGGSGKMFFDDIRLYRSR
jgi:The GLUG motif